MSLRTLVLPLAFVACTPGPAPAGPAPAGSATEGASTSTSTSTQSESGTATASSDVTTTGSTTTATTDAHASTTGFSFIAPHDVPVCTHECDPWTQNCPDGQKCMPYSGDGDNAWESLKCVNIVPDPDGVGEPCTVFGSGVSGEDTCDEGLMCWDLDEMGIGHCVAMCIGSPDAPECADPFADCVVANGGVLILCFPQCDPIAQDCANDQQCIVHDDGFLCVLEGQEPGNVLDPCEYANACDKGLACVEPALAVECDPMALGCCLPLCDTDEPITCPGEGHECVPWYDDLADAAPHNVDVGLCRLPMP